MPTYSRYKPLVISILRIIKPTWCLHKAYIEVTQSLHESALLSAVACHLMAMHIVFCLALNIKFSREFSGLLTAKCDSKGIWPPNSLENSKAWNRERKPYMQVICSFEGD